MSAIDDLLQKTPEAQHAALQKIRESIHVQVPEAEEVMTYGMPGFKYKGKYLIAFAAFKDHMSIFPGAEVTTLFKSELAGYKTSKGTIQFSVDKPLPPELLQKIITHCVERIDATIKK